MEASVVRCGVVNKKSGSFRSIHQCLIVLGAKRRDVYAVWNKDHRSIYHRYEKWELEYMAKALWRESVMKYHPDLASVDERELYEYMIAEINAAYDRIVHILRNK